MIDPLPPVKYDRAPSYFVYGGIVFTPLTENLLATWGDDWDEDAPSHLLTLNNEFKAEECEQAIILSKVLAHDLNRGFENYEQSRITHLNGKKLLNMRDLVRRIETEKDSPFLVFTDKDGLQIVLNRERAAAAHREILDIYGVGADRSEDLAGAGGLTVAGRLVREALTAAPWSSTGFVDKRIGKSSRLLQNKPTVIQGRSCLDRSPQRSRLLCIKHTQGGAL
jgi:hypothetical protein